MVEDPIADAKAFFICLLRVLLIAALVVIVPVYFLKLVGFHDWGTWRYKVTVEVDAPDGVRTGSSVWEVSNYAMKLKLLPGIGNPAEARGEAIVIDMGNGLPLFATLGGCRGDGIPSLLYKVFGGGSSVEGIRHLNKLKRGDVRDVPKYAYPLIVYFEDLDDPESIKVFEGSQCSKCEGGCDAGNIYKNYTVRSVRMEIVGSEVNSGSVLKYMPWIVDYKFQTLDGNKTFVFGKNDKNARKFTYFDFISGF